MEHDKWPVYVLAGGQSRRFDGDKVLALLDGTRLIVRALQPFQPRQVIALVDRAGRLGDLHLPVLVDETPQHGPAHALENALRHRGQGWLWLTACDTLGVQSEWLEELQAEAKLPRLALAFRDTHWQPFPSLWHTDALPLVQKCLKHGENSLQQLFEAVKAKALKPPLDFDRLRRVNTQEALLAAQAAPGTQALQVLRLQGKTALVREDWVIQEAPLQVVVRRGVEEMNLGVTLRTPGQEAELAVGLAFSEQLLQVRADLLRVSLDGEVATLELSENSLPLLQKPERVRLANASCGACGKADLDVTQVKSRVLDENWQIPSTLFGQIPDVLKRAQKAFQTTGGVHGVGIFDENGQLLQLAEDVGRHNALDKLIGAAFLRENLPWRQRILLLSGRVAYELVQKAALAGVPVIVAVGAPSSLAVQVAQQAGITLVGFAGTGPQRDRANVYTHPQRVRVA